ncbi:MAG: M48 family metalloprotease [Desulfobacteraceae bacterium]|nr:M48 family metalloprotease [Desulfobacteraceae bacterium]
MFTRRILTIGYILFTITAILITGCKTLETVTKIGTSIGVATGTIDQSHAESIQKSTRAISRSFEDFTPEQEYYIGRTVGAVIASKYRPYKNRRANRYLNLLGQTLAQASDLPETFGGYHFLILDSDEINAFAASGGLIFITRGMLRCCRNEDAVAAVLAHEIGHVQYRHGLQAIKKSRITSALTTLAIEGTKTFSGADIANLLNAFEGSITDITGTLINNGYSRKFEQQADKAAVTILKRVGYNPNGLVEMLNIMQKRLKPGSLDFAKTHPSPDSRIADIQKSIGPYSDVNKTASRQKRFSELLGGI